MLKTIFILFLSMLGTVLFFALFVFIFANSVVMTCERQENNTYNCGIEKKFLGKVTIFKSNVAGVVGAQIDESCDSDGCSYRTELVTAGGESTPFNDVYTDRDPVRERTNQINSYLRQQDSRSFTVEDPLQLWVLFLLGGLGTLFLGMEAMFIFMEAFRWVVNRR